MMISTLCSFICWRIQRLCDRSAVEMSGIDESKGNHCGGKREQQAPSHSGTSQGDLNERLACAGRKWASL
jgi:hypothetical protein